MGRIKPAWYYERQREEAERRETFYKNRQAPPTGTTVKSRGAATTLFYRSLTQRFGAEPVIYRVNVTNDTISRISAAEAGLKEELGSDEVGLNLRGSGVKPTRVHWYRGDTTPVRVKTDWNTSWTRYYDNTGDRSHYSIPFSLATGLITVDEVQEKFDGLFGKNGTKRTLLGSANGRAYLTFERAPVSFNT